jgi:uncharacterized repeat protein (TIGR01451 family)
LDLPEGSVLTYTITGVVDSSAAGTLSNTAGLIETRFDNNTASTATSLGAEASLSIVKSHVLDGEWMTYSVAVFNAGPSDALGALVSDTVPAGLSDFA